MDVEVNHRETEPSAMIEGLPAIPPHDHINYQKGFGLVRDEKAQNSHGGTFTLGAWRTRDLTQIRQNRDGVITSLIANQFTLEAGNYLVRGSAPAESVDSHQTRLWNVTDGTRAILGSSSYSGGTSATRSDFIGYISITSSKVFELQHRSTGTKSVTGFGRACNFTTEVYAIVEIYKLIPTPVP